MSDSEEGRASEARDSEQAGGERLGPSVVTPPGEEWFRSLAENLPDVIARFDRELRHIYVNRETELRLGLPRESILGKTNRELGMPAELVAYWEQEMRQVFATGRVRELEFSFPRPAGKAYFESRIIPELGPDGTVISVLGINRDITARREAEQKLRQDAFYDVLTGLPNRASLMERLEHAMQVSKRNTHCLTAVLFLDFDHFKIINDSLGHTVGDQLLVGLARRLESCLRGADTVARLGGDEFVILLEDIEDSSYTIRVAERVLKTMTEPFTISGQEVFTNASIGIALKAPGHERPEELLRDADTALYRAKALGRGRYEVFDNAMRAEVMRRLQLETDLRRALDKQELCLYYQPILTLRNQRLIGFEALVRWQHPVQGLIPPSEFIKVAEETGLIVPMDRWVLSEACRQLRHWQTSAPAGSGAEQLTINVNLSSKNLTRADLVEHIQQVLSETGLDAHSLKLEITESVIMENSAAAAAMLLRLRDMGIRLCMDDFGTGYSSLSYLHQFPIDTLKIDRSFVSRITETERHSEIIHAILSLASSLSMEVVAEGIETPVQLSTLKALGCNHGQGYFFSGALETAAAAALAARGYADGQGTAAPAPAGG